MSIEIVRTRDALREKVRFWRRASESIGLVPTMGALHEGHLDLIRRSVAQNEHTIVTVFVNPLQFGPNEDFAAYPRDLERDTRLAESAGATVVFAPEREEMYPANDATFVEVEQLTDGLCGASRPGHFRGVTTIVARLFLLTSPDRAYFGQKDAQQARVLRRMTIDLGFDLEVVIVPTVREPDGLALSSRNRYLTPEDRARALCLSRALFAARDAHARGEVSAAALLQVAREKILGVEGVELDYLELVDDETLARIESVERPALLAVAARVGSARLIDNLVLGHSRLIAPENGFTL
ncbi:MAG: pantoate--beta-alanine ligase [Planctomycetota bacterium]